MNTKVVRKQCVARVTLRTVIANPTLDMKAELRDVRHCGKRHKHKGPHQFLIVGDVQGKVTMLKVTW